MKDLKNTELPFSENELDLIKRDIRSNKDRIRFFISDPLEERSEIKVWSIFGFSFGSLFG